MTTNSKTYCQVDIMTNKINFNIGVLGHVDSGKTSLSKALSTVASTACFDKNPQSKERGITLDLGFSSFSVDTPAKLKENGLACDEIQYTLVDCPGHASLIRTIIGGAQIIDLMMLVVDIVKGVQTQTAECLVIGEILCNKMIVILNKVDLIPPDKRQATVDKMKKRMLKTLEKTRFADSPIIAVAAKPGGAESDSAAEGVSDLIELIKSQTYLPNRDPSGPFVFAVDHCFSIRGQGTVMTGTVLSGSAAINDNLEIPSLKVQKKVKSIQMFKKPVEKVIQGDRAGICVTQFDPKQLERGYACTPGVLPTVFGAVIDIHKIPYFKGALTSKSKFHISLGHETVMGHLSFFGLMPDQQINDKSSSFDFNLEYKHQNEYIMAASGEGEGGEITPVKQYALIELEKPVICSATSLLIGSRLDTDINTNTCRLAFYGRLLEIFTDPAFKTQELPKLKVYKLKSREGLVDRVMDEYTVIGKNLFKKETNIDAFSGMKIELSSGEKGIIEGTFGQSGKIKIRIASGLSQTTIERYAGMKKKKGKGKQTEGEETHEESHMEPVRIILTFKRYIYDPQKKMKQT